MKLSGKYGTADVFASNVEYSALDQIKLLLNQPFVAGAKIAIMPDVHAGKGCTIGFTMTVQDKIIPNLVGVDIGCGMLSVLLPLSVQDIDLAKFDKDVREKIPTGMAVHRSPVTNEFINSYNTLKCNYRLRDIDRIFNAIGSLGGGNHFVELNKDKFGQVCLIIHSGSRNLGMQIATIYQDRAIENCDIYHSGEHIPRELCYLENEDVEDYLHDVAIAQKYATLNRYYIGKIICEDILGIDYSACKRMQTIHNYIDPVKKILRKGAISAEDGEIVIIPINMKDGTILGIGKGNPDWNFSGPHGAGRLLSRSQAKKTLSVDAFRLEMQEAGIYTSSVGESTLDEAPGAYKSIDTIMETLFESVEIMDVLKPIYNLKDI